MLKVYGIHGRTQAIVKVPVNNNQAWLECEFNYGRIGAGIGNRPATYATSDEVEQSIIENSPLFGQLIVLVRTSGGEKREEKAEPVGPQLKAITSVTSREEAVAYLKQNGAKAVNLKDNEAMDKYAAKIGVWFPNLG